MLGGQRIVPAGQAGDEVLADGAEGRARGGQQQEEQRGAGAVHGELRLQYCAGTTMCARVEKAS